MSGLFATLAAAAHGDAEALRARPRGRFEPEAGALPEMTMAERSASEEPDEEQTHRPAPRPREGQRVARAHEAASPSQPLMPRAPVAADPIEGRAEAADRRDGGPHHSDQPRSRSLRAEPPERTGNAAATSAPLLPSAERVSEAETPNASHYDADASTPARHIPKDRAPLPMLPVAVDPLAEPVAANSSFAPNPSEPAAPRARQTRSLSIGRIEVRPAPPPPPPPTPQASYRATIIPRAQPRQSLDEYRRRGR
ncbi:hypothetical protein [Porphyrobacter sp. YT40]|uniref:hypothetical protein n=1 Tax=Porphyrobacter sp. YT40 TaxID=2547601 RepID=UPI001142BF2F|nr:hypothetical protein [Porphyrobacter sp. YT40]QDH33217.1 hypothetical protein E2E27_02010 [Porphyrobacter sp. YT40]